jgi:hypothetical protein
MCEAFNFVSYIHGLEDGLEFLLIGCMIKDINDFSFNEVKVVGLEHAWCLEDEKFNDSTEFVSFDVIGVVVDNFQKGLREMMSVLMSFAFIHHELLIAQYSISRNVDQKLYDIADAWVNVGGFSVEFFK